MSSVQISTWIMLVFCGLWAGGILVFAVERTNLWRRMSIEEYSIDFRRSLFRVDPMMPILNIVGVIAAIVFAWHQVGHAEWLAWIGVACMLLVVVISVTIAEPVNSKFRRLPEGQVPERAEYYRTFWRRFHLARTAVAMTALVCLSAATVS